MSGAPCVSMLRMYVRTVHKKIEIQKSVKNPYSDDSHSGEHRERGWRAYMARAYPELVFIRALVIDIKVR